MRQKFKNFLQHDERDVASKIFTVVPIMSGLVLVGIAISFVLLRVEAVVDNSE
jgi:hypothetical protein